MKPKNGEGKVLEIVTVDKNLDFLRQKSQPLTIDQIKSPEIQQFIQDMIATTNAKEDRAGLSAVQVGKHYQLLIVAEINEDYEFTGEIIVMINPTLEIDDYTQVTEIEACLSIPKVQGKVDRYRRVRVTYHDEDGVQQRKKFSGYTARIIQHEYDHLIGVLFTDKMHK